MLTDAAARSAIGAVYITPSMPKRYGKISSSGSRKIICLVSERKIPFFGAPMEVKKFELTGWIPFRNVKTGKCGSTALQNAGTLLNRNQKCR